MQELLPAFSYHLRFQARPRIMLRIGRKSPSTWSGPCNKNPALLRRYIILFLCNYYLACRSFVRLVYVHGIWVGPVQEVFCIAKILISSWPRFISLYIIPWKRSKLFCNRQFCIANYSTSVGCFPMAPSLLIYICFVPYCLWYVLLIYLCFLHR